MSLMPVNKLQPWVRIRASYLASALPGFFDNGVESPIFITGCGRSGTTLLRKLVASHKDVSAFPTEAGDLWAPRGYPWRNSSLETPPRWDDPLTFTQMELKAWNSSDSRRIKRIFGAYQALTGKKYFLNKCPAMALMVPHALELFPSAHFIHVYRDGRAVALSWAKREYSRMQEESDLYKSRGYYVSFESLLKKTAASWRDHILTIEKQVEEHQLDKKGVFIELRYEDCCAAPDEELHRIAEFLDLDPDGFGSFPVLESSNYKYQEDLDSTTIKELTRIMEPALKAKGYLV